MEGSGGCQRSDLGKKGKWVVWVWSSSKKKSRWQERRSHVLSLGRFWELWGKMSLDRCVLISLLMRQKKRTEALFWGLIIISFAGKGRFILRSRSSSVVAALFFYCSLAHSTRSTSSHTNLATTFSLVYLDGREGMRNLSFAYAKWLKDGVSRHDYAILASTRQVESSY